MSGSSAILENKENAEMRFYTNASERMRIDSSGNVGIGTTSPAQKLDVTSTNNIAYALDGWALAGKGDSSDILIGGILPSQFDTFSFYTSGSERMRIRSTGGVMIGNDGSNRIGEPNLHVQHGGASNNVASFFFADTSDRDALLIRHNRAVGGTNAPMINFLNGSGNGVGHIHATGSAVTYNSVSDYRLKENVVAISDGITRLKTLKPSRFNFIADADTTVDGFLAHEVTAVPEAITGTKDKVDENDKPIYQEIDQSKLVPLLTAALQEAIVRIEALEAK